MVRDSPAAILDNPGDLSAGDVLAVWRAAERRLETVTEDAPERRAILGDIAEFRERYQLLFHRGLGNFGAKLVRRRSPVGVDMQHARGTVKA